MEKKSHKWTWLWYVLAGALVLCDQVVKNYIRATMTLGESKPFIPHLIELYYVENTGAAFSLFSRYTWLLALLSGVVTIVLVFAVWRDWFAATLFPRLCVALVLAGAAGNLVDRVFRGQVTDMFNFTFIRFGVFNVADICVVCGIIGYAGYVLYAQYVQSKTGGEDTHEADADRA